MMENIYNLKILKTNQVFEKNNYSFCQVETDPRLRYIDCALVGQLQHFIC